MNEHPPHIASLLSAAAQSCDKLQSLAALIGNDDAIPLSDDISRLSRLTALALHHNRLTGLSGSMSTLTSLRQLSVSALGSQLHHSLSALANLHTLQVLAEMLATFG